MQFLITGGLLVAAIIHLMPLIGVLGVDKLNSLYGNFNYDSNLELLMRHRAVLFGIVGGILALGAFCRPFTNLALVVGFVSVLSFLILALSIGNYNDLLRRVFLADIVALVGLSLAAIGQVVTLMD